jgi:hypothetical protein
MAPDADSSADVRRTTESRDDVFAIGLTGGETR